MKIEVGKEDLRRMILGSSVNWMIAPRKLPEFISSKGVGQMAGTWLWYYSAFDEMNEEELYSYYKRIRPYLLDRYPEYIPRLSHVTAPQNLFTAPSAGHNT